jgi:glutamate-1-semialdehyde aminotransferase
MTAPRFSLPGSSGRQDHVALNQKVGRAFCGHCGHQPTTDVSPSELENRCLGVHLMACYHDGTMTAKRTTTIRMPEDLADTVEIVARGRGISVNALVIEALLAEVERVKQDQQFVATLRKITERDKEILDRLAQ